MKQVEVFETTDGQRFDDKEAAANHQKHLDHAGDIEAFLDKHYPNPADGRKGPSRAIAKAAIEKWMEEN